jgi:hypothetical protein
MLRFKGVMSTEGPLKDLENMLFALNPALAKKFFLTFSHNPETEGLPAYHCRI